MLQETFQEGIQYWHLKAGNVCQGSEADAWNEPFWLSAAAALQQIATGFQIIFSILPQSVAPLESKLVVSAADWGCAFYLRLK